MAKKLDKKATKKRKSKSVATSATKHHSLAKKPLYNCAGYDIVGAREFVESAEQNDIGTARYPWPKSIKAILLNKINGSVDLAEASKRLDAIVVEKLGSGLFGKGPLS